MNLGINLIDLTLMTLIEPSQLDYSLQNCDNLICIGLVNWIDDFESILQPICAILFMFYNQNFV